MYHMCDTIIQLGIAVELIWDTLSISQGYQQLSGGKSLLSRHAPLDTPSQGCGVDNVVHPWQLILWGLVGCVTHQTGSSYLLLTVKGMTCIICDLGCYLYLFLRAVLLLSCN